MAQPLPRQLPDIDDLPVVESAPLTRHEERLIERYEEIDSQSLERLIDAGKRLVEWSTAAVGIFFAALALINNPTVLTAFGRIEIKWVSGAAIVFYLLAVSMGYLASMPRQYKRRRYSLDDMREQDLQMHHRKYRWLRLGSLFFSLGTGALGVVILLLLTKL
jgi:hypothetical protein